MKCSISFSPFGEDQLTLHEPLWPLVHEYSIFIPDEIDASIGLDPGKMKDNVKLEVSKFDCGFLLAQTPIISKNYESRASDEICLRFWSLVFFQRIRVIITLGSNKFSYIFLILLI